MADLTPIRHACRECHRSILQIRYNKQSITLSSPMNFPLFRGVPEKALTEFLYGIPSQLRVLKPGDVLFRQGDLCENLHILAQGKVRAQMKSEGKVLTIEEFTGPTLLASAIVFTSDPHFPVTATATTEAEVFVVSRSRFVDFMLAHRSVLEGFLADVSERTLFLSRRLKSFALQSLKSRLLEYLSVHGRIDNQEEVAKIMGVARPSLSRALAELIAEGKVKK